MSELRPYQREALDAIYNAWYGGARRVGVSLPTGVGKTHIMAHLGRDMADEGQRVLYLLHRDTLVEQTAAKLRAVVSPGTSIGVLKASRNEVGARVIIASVHSLRSEARRRTLPPIGTCVVDEAHVSVTPTYRAVFETIGALGDAQGANLAGFSATWTRSDDTGLGDVWQDIVYRRSIKWAIAQGHLVTPRALQVGHGVDTDGLKVSRNTGDYTDADLEATVMIEDLRSTVVDAVRRHGGSRPAVLFAPTVAAAEYFGDALREAGISAAGIYGETPPAVRRPRFRDHANGTLQVLTTCTALAEGWDAPHCSLGVLVRPTKHEGLFVQMVGRLLRPWPGKSDALLLDLVGSTSEVKLRNACDLNVTKEVEPDLHVPVEVDPDAEPVGQERKVKRIRSTHEVELFAGTSVQWLRSPSGLAFVPCGDEMIFLVEGPDGWNIGRAATSLGGDGRPSGSWLAEGLSQTDALESASDAAEDAGMLIAAKSASWRRAAPSTAQINFATGLGIENPEQYTKGGLSDEISVRRANYVLNYFADWSRKVTS